MESSDGPPPPEEVTRTGSVRGGRISTTDEEDCNDFESTTTSGATQEMVRLHHSRAKGPDQCGSINVQFVAAPLAVVWSLVRRFDRPQAYKLFLRSCALRAGAGGVGSVREVKVASGLPATTSTERLDSLDEERHVMSFSMVGGDHRLRNYRATTSVHAAGGGTELVESYVVDVPAGNTEEDTRVFADTIVRCNLRWLASLAEGMVALELPSV